MLIDGEAATVTTPLDRARRRILALAYLVFSVGGIATIISPPGTFTTQSVTGLVLWGWIASLAIGGLLGVLGAGLRRAALELAGLGLLSTGFLAYAVAIISLPHRTGGIWLVASIVSGVILFFVARYLEILRASRVRGSRQ